MLNFLPIDKNSVPYSFSSRIAGETFTFTVNYNAEGDFFTIDLQKGVDGEILAVGEKVSYGRPLFGAYSREGFPKAAIIPWDMADQETRVGWDQLSESVLLYLVTQEDVENA